MKPNVTYIIAILLFMSSHLSNAGASKDSMKTELQYQLNRYTSCQKECSKELAADIINGSIDVALATFGLNEVQTKSKTLRNISFLAYIRLVYETGNKSILSEKMCSSKCDAMYNDIVTLGRKGALGPLVKGKELDDEFFNDQDVLNILKKYVKPINPEDLPPHFHNEIWWNQIQNTV